MGYGYFSSDRREYIITRPDTPRPWVNYLFNDKYHALISQTGGGFSYCRDPKYNRVHKYERMLSDRSGRYFFLHDMGNQETWSATWQPMMRPYQKFETRHGLGYTIITTRYFDIETRMIFFVPVNEPCEVCLVEMTNHSLEKKELKTFPFVDFVAGDAQLEIDYPNIMSLYNRATFNSDLNAILAYKQPYPLRQNESCAFFATSAKVAGFDCAREEFLGRYGSLNQPEVVVEGRCRNSIVSGEDMVGVFEHEIALSPGASSSFVLVTGFVDDETLPSLQPSRTEEEDFYPELPSKHCKQKIKEMLDTFLNIEDANRALDSVKTYWHEKTSRLTVKTPDQNFDLMTNIWGQYQLFGITQWRGTSAYHTAEGGKGYRDTAQDAEGVLALDVDLAKKILDDLLCYQYANGHAISGFSEKEGSWEKQSEDTVTGKSDMAVWLIYTVVAYLEETGDFGFLEKSYSFLDGAEATVYDHCLRAIEFLTSNLGEHGMPLIGKADWNDAYDRLGYRGRGESVWLAMATIRAIRKLSDVAQHLGQEERRAQLAKKAAEMQASIKRHGWDGEWFLAAINDVGLRVGSNKNAQGKLPLNSQTWAILSGIANNEQALELAELIDRELDTDYGPVLFSPVYTDYHPGIGRVTSFAPGTKENAAVFSHAAAFKVVADCMVKRGNAAYQTFCKIMPTNPKKADQDYYKVEPYVYAEYIVGPGHPSRFGEGAFTWNTGTAPWMFMAATEWICGVRRTLKGLLIDPCIPAKWDRFEVTRPFRGVTYHITVENPDHVQSGVKEILVDGKKIEGQLIKPFSYPKTCKVHVIMGEAK